MDAELTRPIIGIENRAPQEVFDIMADRIRGVRRTPSEQAGADGQFSIDERDNDMLITERDWQFGRRCIARRPRLLTNDEWRPVAQRIIVALSRASTPPASEPVEDAIDRAADAVERAARALCKASGKNPDQLIGRLDVDGKRFAWADYQYQARAVLAALAPVRP